jgi:hypothetical protein
MKNRHLGLALVPFLVLVGAVAVQAGPAVTGGGQRAGFTLAGNIHLAGEGAGTGHFIIVIHTEPAILCRYTSFDDIVVTATTATFHSVGLCTGSPFGPFESDNVFTIIDNGEPGIGVDVVDVNFLGGTGVAVPGGFLDAGNFQVRP